MKRFALAIGLCFASGATIAADWNPGPYDAQGNPNYRYRGQSGQTYQYDLNRPQDRTRYELDPGAQIKDSVTVNPKIDFDNAAGQRGGGARRHLGF